MRAVLKAAALVDGSIAVVARVVLVATGSAVFVALLLSVALRYVFTESLPWATELPVLIFPLFVMAGVVLAAQQGQHVAVEFLLLRLNARWRRVLLIAVHLIVAAAYVLVIDSIGGIMPIAASERSPILGVPGTLTYGALAAGFGLITASSLIQALRLACGLETPASGPAETFAS